MASVIMDFTEDSVRAAFAIAEVVVSERADRTVLGWLSFKLIWYRFTSVQYAFQVWQCCGFEVDDKDGNCIVPSVCCSRSCGEDRSSSSKSVWLYFI